MNKIPIPKISIPNRNTFKPQLPKPVSIFRQRPSATTHKIGNVLEHGGNIIETIGTITAQPEIIAVGEVTKQAGLGLEEKAGIINSIENIIHHNKNNGSSLSRPRSIIKPIAQIGSVLIPSLVPTLVPTLQPVSDLYNDFKSIKQTFNDTNYNKIISQELDIINELGDRLDEDNLTPAKFLKAIKRINPEEIENYIAHHLHYFQELSPADQRKILLVVKDILNL